MSGLTPKMAAALSRVSRFSPETSVKWASASECCSTPGVMGALVRHGLARSCVQTERPIGQRAYSYGLYQITPLGAQFLRAHQSKDQPR